MLYKKTKSRKFLLEKMPVYYITVHRDIFWNTVFKRKNIKDIRYQGVVEMKPTFPI